MLLSDIQAAQPHTYLCVHTHIHIHTRTHTQSCYMQLCFTFRHFTSSSHCLWSLWLKGLLGVQLCSFFSPSSPPFLPPCPPLSPCLPPSSCFLLLTLLFLLLLLLFSLHCCSEWLACALWLKKPPADPVSLAVLLLWQSSSPDASVVQATHLHSWLVY